MYDMGLRLKELREKNKLSQSQVAARIGITKSGINSYEQGTAKPSADRLRKLALLYQVTSDYLLGIDQRETIVLDGLSEREKKLVRSILDLLLFELKTR